MLSTCSPIKAHLDVEKKTMLEICAALKGEKELLARQLIEADKACIGGLQMAVTMISTVFLQSFRMSLGHKLK
jgi:hypothetical protein